MKTTMFAALSSALLLAAAAAAPKPFQPAAPSDGETVSCGSTSVGGGVLISTKSTPDTYDSAAAAEAAAANLAVRIARVGLGALGISCEQNTCSFLGFVYSCPPIVLFDGSPGAPVRATQNADGSFTGHIMAGNGVDLTLQCLFCPTGEVFPEV